MRPKTHWSNWLSLGYWKVWTSNGHLTRDVCLCLKMWLKTEQVGYVLCLRIISVCVYIHWSQGWLSNTSRYIIHMAITFIYTVCIATLSAWSIHFNVMWNCNNLSTANHIYIIHLQNSELCYVYMLMCYHANIQYAQMLRWMLHEDKLICYALGLLNVGLLPYQV